MARIFEKLLGEVVRLLHGPGRSTELWDDLVPVPRRSLVGQKPGELRNCMEGNEELRESNGFGVQQE